MAVWMGMEPELPALTLDAYRLPVVDIRCHLCGRHADQVSCAVLRRKYGNVTLGEAALRVARAGKCVRAGEGAQNYCQARPFEPTIWVWANLDQARRLGYSALLHCRRHFAALKATQPCRGAVVIDFDNMIAVFGHDFPLEKLTARLQCPSCGTKLVGLEWLAPAGGPSPGGTQAPDVEPVRPKVKPETARKAFRAIGGGRR
jgi:hypothetical protein